MVTNHKTVDHCSTELQWTGAIIQTILKAARVKKHVCAALQYECPYTPFNIAKLSCITSLLRNSDVLIRNLYQLLATHLSKNFTCCSLCVCHVCVTDCGRWWTPPLVWSSWRPFLPGGRSSRLERIAVLRHGLFNDIRLQASLKNVPLCEVLVLTVTLLRSRRAVQCSRSCSLYDTLIIFV